MTRPVSRPLDALTIGHLHPADQAEGLRQMFATRVLRFVPVVANPAAGCGGLVLERLCTAFTGFGLRTLVVDASDQARPPSELAAFDLAEGIESLSPQIGYMPARGLPLKFVDAHGVCDSLLSALADASPQSDVILVHASASELVRVFGRPAKGHDLRPLLFTNDLAEGLRDAYTAVKVLTQRGGWMAYDLLVCATARSQQAEPVADRLAQCADAFLGAAQRSWQLLDPRESALAPLSPQFLKLAADVLHGALPHALGDTAFDQLMSPGAALPSRATPLLN